MVNNRDLFYGIFIYTRSDRNNYWNPIFYTQQRIFKIRFSSDIQTVSRPETTRRETVLKREIPGLTLARDRMGPSNFTNPMDTSRHGGGQLPMCVLVRYYYGLTAEIHAKRSNLA